MTDIEYIFAQFCKKTDFEKEFKHFLGILVMQKDKIRKYLQIIQTVLENNVKKKLEQLIKT